MKINCDMKWFNMKRGLAALLASAAVTASQAAISINTGLNGPLTFDTQPTSASGWTTLSYGASSTTAIQDAATMDSVIQTIAASTITTELASSTTYPPSANAVARWNNNATSGFFIQTRPTGNTMTLLMAALQNDSGSVVTNLTIAYDFGALTSADSTINESPELYGQRVYWSLTGAAGTWTLIPSLSGVANPGPLTASLDLGTWGPGTTLYILWADDNGPSSDAAPQKEGAYTIDNLTFTATSGGGGAALAIFDANLPANLTVLQYTRATFIFSVTGNSPSFQWYLNGQRIPGATSASYAIASAALTNAGNYYCIATNTFNSVTSRVATLTVTPSSPPGAIAIGSGTNGPITFSTQADTNGFRTLSIAGGTGDITDVTGMNTSVQTNLAANITTALPTTTTVPPGMLGNAQWNSAGQYLQTRPTGNSYTLLMATLLNNAGSAISSLTIEYDFGALTSADSTIVESAGLYGQQVYWSLTGAANSWTLIPSLSGVADPGHLTATFNPGVWAAGSPLYILWADDNGPQSDTAPTKEGAYTIDNLSFNAVPASGPVTILNPNLPASLTPNEYGSATFTVSLGGGAPAYQWYKNGAAIPGATSSSYTLNNVNSANNGSFYCVATNNFNSITSRVATLTVIPDQIQPAIASVQSIGASNVVVTFTEPVNPATATNLANYQMLTQAGAPIGIGAIALTNNNVVTLQLSGARSVAVDDLLTVRGVQDVAYVPNTILTTTKLVPGLYNKPIFTINGQTWRYNTNGLDLGIGWREEVYDDSTWPSGPGILGREDTAATLAGYAAQGVQYLTPFPEYSRATMTFYFRTTFVVTNSIAGLGLAANGFLDDGAIFWLNGQKAGVYRMTFSSNYTYTAASEGGAVGGVLEYTMVDVPLNPLYLREGVNTLAVEMHQDGTNSSDIVLGIGLNLVMPGPLAITSQPVSTNIAAGTNASFAVAASGSVQNYQWYFNNQPIIGANQATYALTAAAVTNAGSYSVVVYNSQYSVTSQVATLAVRVDNIPPFVTYSVMSTNNTYDSTYVSSCTVTIQFSEPVNPADATNLANYFISREGDPTNTTLTIYSAALAANGTNLTLVTSAKQESPVVNYRLYIGNIRDLAPTPNVMPATMQFMYQRLFLMYGGPSQVWKYDWSGANLGATWKEPTYNDTAWTSGNGPFYTLGEQLNANFPMNWGEPSAIIPFSQTVTTYYYRTTFNLPADPAGVQLQFEIAMDDGGVFWLNGAEVKNTTDQNGRYYMTNGTETVYATTFAQNHEAGTPSQRAPVYPIVLRNGANVLAVEVHQSAIDITNAQPDSAFAMQIIATLPPISKPLRPTLTAQPANLTTNAGNNVTFRAAGDGTMPVTARWYFNTNTFLSAQTLTSATNIIALTRNNVGAADEGTYTLVLSNAAGSVTSTVATLTVLRTPVFTLQPAGANVAVGATVGFAATVTGTLPLNYQWYFNGVNRIYGETNATLTLRNAQTDNTGAYSLRAWNTVGTNTSTAVTLTVTGGTASQPRLGNLVFAGGGGTFSLKVLTETGRTYTLQYNNVASQTGWLPVPGAGATAVGDGTTKTLTDTSATVPKRFYRMAVQ
jgi:hypothetical protein